MGGLQQTVADCGLTAMFMLLIHIRTVNSLAGSSSAEMQQGQFRRQKPSRGSFKCNVDASFSAHLNVVGYGMCIRDEVGNFVKERTMSSSPVCVSDIGEALGLSQAIQWVHELQLPNIDFEMPRGL